MKICRDREITNVISSKCREIDQYINNLSDEDVMSEQDEKIINNMYELYRIEPIEIDEEIYENRKINKTTIKQYNPFASVYPRNLYEPEYYNMDGVEITCSFPFVGDEIIFYVNSSLFC